MKLLKKFQSEIYDGDVAEGHLELLEITEIIFRRIYNKTKPKRVLEIGFNAGHSAYLWLNNFPEVTYHSVDICFHEYTEECANKMQALYPNFSFTKIDSRLLTPNYMSAYDMIFIDGDHYPTTFRKDFDTARKSGVRWILVDDYATNKFNHHKHIYVMSEVVHNNINDPYERVDVQGYMSNNDTITSCALFEKKR